MCRDGNRRKNCFSEVGRILGGLFTKCGNGDRNTRRKKGESDFDSARFKREEVSMHVFALFAGNPAGRLKLSPKVGFLAYRKRDFPHTVAAPLRILTGIPQRLKASYSRSSKGHHSPSLVERGNAGRNDRKALNMQNNFLKTGKIKDPDRKFRYGRRGDPGGEFCL